MVSAIFILLMTYSVVSAQGGSGDLKIGYIYIDEEGNRSISQSSFNYYDGASISVENFHYRFKNGLRIRSSLQNINLDNRNLSFGLGKPGRFGVDINTNRYRRVYDFEGDSQTKRDMTGGNIWFNPSRYLKVYALGSFNSVKYEGRMFQAEYNTISYTDNLDESKNQSRKRVRLFGHFPVPDYEWLTLSGSLEKFETEYDDTGFKLESTTARGSVTSELVRYLSATYVSYFTRAGSDRDFVETDNLAHLIYISYNPPQKFGLTAGYQYDINDDYADVVKADSYYLSGRLKPFEGIELNAVYGIRAEEVDEGARLVGDEDRARFKIQGKYHKPDIGSVKIGVESRSRINDKLDSEADFNRYFVQSNLNSLEYFIVSGGYSYSRGDYDNAGADFEFESQQVNLNII
jgi:hypothetical protein